MSILFHADDEVVWNPSNSVAQLFLSVTKAAERHVGLESGISSIASDEVHIDYCKLRRFKETLANDRHTVVVYLFSGYLDCLEVLEFRARPELVETMKSIVIAKSMPT